MRTEEFTVSDLECVSCERVVEKALLKAGAKRVGFSGTTVSAAFPESVKESALIDAVRGAGHEISKRAKGASWKIERTAFSYASISLAAFIALEFAILYSVFGSDWLAKRAPWLIILGLTAVLSASALAQMSSYKGNVSCMTGMMLGMTAGMQGGMLSGYVLGVTNGFFTGALVSTAFGMAFGYLAGRRGGLMASLQGLMSGFMGGAMGAMTSVMMVGWGFEAFTLWFSLANAAIFFGFFPMVAEYVSQGKTDSESQFPAKEFFLHFISGAAVLSLVMIFGPAGLLGW